MIAQEKGLYVKAAENYRNALDLHLGFDQLLAASGTATGLGIVLAQLGRHDEAAQAFLCAAIAWHEETRHWPSHNLQQLHREREIIGSRQFAILVKTYIRSPNLEHELAAAVDASEDPEKMMKRAGQRATEQYPANVHTQTLGRRRSPPIVIGIRGIRGSAAPAAPRFGSVSSHSGNQ